MGKCYGVAMSEYDKNHLEHFGIKGQKWGIRRFQNEDGSYTPEGKERYYKNYDAGVKKGKYDNDPELRDIYVMEQTEIDKQIRRAQKPLMSSLSSDSKALTKGDRKIIEKLRNGEELSAKESKALEDAWKKYANDNYDLGNKHTSILKKYDAYSHDNPIPPDAKKINDQLAEKIEEGRKAIAEINYADALNEEREYAKSIRDDINSAKNQKYVDPAYRTFSSKEEKAKAEAEYMKNTWQIDHEPPGDQERWTDEAMHIMHKMTLLSMNGYEGIPKSERNKAMYDYEARTDYDRFAPFDTYENWIPKYEKTDEWKALQKRREKAYVESGYNRLNEEYHNAIRNNLSKKEIDKLYKAMHEAFEEREAKLDEIRKEERRIEEPFYTQVAKNVLLDLGYEVTPENIECVFPIVWYD